ncbi:FKBP prolyl isomerase 16 isoform X2 [Anguilla rostrata]|uniref:FKBP prolyl isomerase 16 isoform X2 n=1 Tax=Anguilla rostrata TaxID=7938 RepID=UPI0030CD9251
MSWAVIELQTHVGASFRELHRLTVVKSLEIQLQGGQKKSFFSLIHQITPPIPPACGENQCLRDCWKTTEKPLGDHWASCGAAAGNASGERGVTMEMTKAIPDPIAVEGMTPKSWTEQEKFPAEEKKDESHEQPTAEGDSPNFVASAADAWLEENSRTLRKTASFGKRVHFRIPLGGEETELEKSEGLEECLFPEYDSDELASSCFEELFLAEDWVDITEDRLLRKKVLEPGSEHALRPVWDQEVTVQLQGVLEDRTVVEKDTKLTFIIGEGDVNQALEECVLSMELKEISLLLADSHYTYGLLGRDPDIPACSPLLYQLQLLDIREKPDPLDLLISDRIRIGNQKRERGNFFFQREEFVMAAQSYCMALHVLTTQTRAGESTRVAEHEEVQECRVKCLNNLAATQMKLEHVDEALLTCQDVLFLDPLNVKALFRKGKLLSDKGEYQEAMETLKKALRLEPSTKENPDATMEETGGEAGEAAGCEVRF